MDDIEEKMTSPVLKKPQDGQVLMDFFDALKELANGKRITKLEWSDENVFGALINEEMMLHKNDNMYYKWILSEADIKGKDWVVLTSSN